MSRKFSHWVRSKAGIASIVGLVIVLLLVAMIGQQLKWWNLNLSGTAGLSSGQYPDPLGGYTCLPTCADDDTKFLMVSKPDQTSSGSEKIVVWIGVPGNKISFDLGIFDGDSGKDSTGNLDVWKGNWDDGTLESTYALYADPMKDGNGSTLLKTWLGNTDNLPDDTWFSQTINNVDSAKAPSKHYFYRLEITQTAMGKGSNAFKLRSNAYLLAGSVDASQYCFPPILKDQPINPNCDVKTVGSKGQQQAAATEQQKLLNASQQAAGIVTYQIITGFISNGQEVRGNFAVENPEALQVILAWETGNINLGLVDPNSRTVSQSDPNVQYQRLANQPENRAIYNFSSAITGNWAFTVTGTNLTQPTPYRIYINSGTPAPVNKLYLPLLQKWSNEPVKPYP